MLNKNTMFLLFACSALTLGSAIDAAQALAHMNCEVTARARSDRVPSDPFIAGDSFRAHADLIFDETTSSFDPSKVFPGAVIFVKTDNLEVFFNQYHPQIHCKYILLTHNSDLPIPGQYAQYLDDPKIIAWFGQNVEGYVHSKLHAVPIGLANRYWPHGDTHVFAEARKKRAKYKRKALLYMNLAVRTNPAARAHVYNMFEKAKFCLKAESKALYHYLLDLAKVKFVLSPRGWGCDTHRTWEALYMDGIPVVLTSSLDPLYDGLPVLIVRDWSEITEEFLKEKYQEMRDKKYDMSRIFMRYWLSKIDVCRQNAL